MGVGSGRGRKVEEYVLLWTALSIVDRRERPGEETAAVEELSGD